MKKNINILKITTTKNINQQFWFNIDRLSENKLASIKARLVQNSAQWVTDWLAKSGATSKAKNENYPFAFHKQPIGGQAYCQTKLKSIPLYRFICGFIKDKFQPLKLSTSQPWILFRVALLDGHLISPVSLIQLLLFHFNTLISVFGSFCQKKKWPTFPPNKWKYVNQNLTKF